MKKRIQELFHFILAIITMVNLIFLFHAGINALLIFVLEVIPAAFSGQPVDAYAAAEEPVLSQPFVASFTSVGYVFTHSVGIMLINFALYILTGGKPRSVLTAVFYGPFALFDALVGKKTPPQERVANESAID